MTLGLIQLLTEISTRNLPGGKARPARKDDNLTAICEPNIYTMWKPRRLKTLRAPGACLMDSFSCLLSITGVRSRGRAVPAEHDTVSKHLHFQ
jgi:hypothetical protein